MLCPHSGGETDTRGKSSFSCSPPLNEAGLHVPGAVDETVRYIGHKFQRISQSPRSLYFRVKVVTPPYFLPYLANVSPLRSHVRTLLPKLNWGGLNGIPLYASAPWLVRKGRGSNATRLATTLKDLLPVGRQIKLYSFSIIFSFGKFHTLTTSILVGSKWAS